MVADLSSPVGTETDEELRAKQNNASAHAATHKERVNQHQDQLRAEENNMQATRNKLADATRDQGRLVGEAKVSQICSRRQSELMWFAAETRR